MNSKSFPSITQNILQNMILNNTDLNKEQKDNIFNPTILDSKYKKMLINQTISNTKIGLYKTIPKTKTVVFSYQNNYNPSNINNICNVSVIHKHSLDIISKYVNNTNTNMPAIMNVVGSDFNGTSFDNEIRDDMINLRTTFNNTVGTTNPYPLKDNECTHSKYVFLIRDPYDGFIPIENIVKFSLITVSPIDNPQLLSETKMTSDNYIKTCSKIETFFQTAIAGNNNILFLSPFGDKEDNNPVNDIIKIYNYCIYKYGFKFNEIIIAIPEYYSNEDFEEYDKNIIRPQLITDEIDMNYDKLEMENNLLNNNDVINDDDELLTKIQTNPALLNMIKKMLVNN